MCHTSAHKHRGSSCSLTPDCAKDPDCAKRTPIRSKARAPSPQSTIASPPATRCALARSLAAAARCCACTPPVLLLPAACAHCWRMTATIARRCHCAGAARQSFFGPAGVAICGQPAPVLHGLHASTRARSTRSSYPQLMRGRDTPAKPTALSRRRRLPCFAQIVEDVEQVHRE